MKLNRQKVVHINSDSLVYLLLYFYAA